MTDPDHPAGSARRIRKTPAVSVDLTKGAEQIVVDGVDVTEAVAGLTIHAKPGSTPTVTLAFATVTVAADVAAARVVGDLTGPAAKAAALEAVDAAQNDPEFADAALSRIGFRSEVTTATEAVLVELRTRIENDR